MERRSAVIVGWPFRAALVLIVALVIHSSVLTQLRIAGVVPDLMLLVAAMAGLAAGPQIGAAFGFAAGLLVDLLLPTPLGLTALTFCLVGFAVGTFHLVLVRSAIWIIPVVAMGASVLGVGLFVLLGAVLGQGHFLGVHALVVMAMVAVLNGVLAIPVNKVVGWALKTEAVA